MEEAKPIDISEESFESEVLNSEIPVMVDFWSPWCGPCRMSTPTVEKIAQAYQGRLKVCKLNIDEALQTAAKYKIMSIPTLCIYKNGQVVEQIAGITPNYEATIKQKIEPYL